MNRHSLKILFIALMLAVCSSFALAQVRIVGSVSGTVQDPSGAVVPGAKVVLKDEGTGIQKDTVSNAQGGFLFPDLNHGTYEITVTATGFQTAVLSRVIVEASKTTDVIAKLTVGQISTVVQVEVAATPVLTSSSNLVASTIASDAIVTLPIDGRNTLGLARLVPGVANPQGGDTHINGMPGGTINVTIDGINNASNGWKSGGTSFYGTVPARMGAVEEINVETGGLSADSGSMSGTNIKFVTKRGNKVYHGQVFYQGRNEAFNANSWSRNAQGQPRNRSRLHMFGGNVGGPLVPFVPYFKDKLFFFINFEDDYTPNTATRSKTLLSAEAQQGIFRYQTSAGEIRTVDVFAIAAANNAPTTRDPIIASFLAKQNAAMSVPGTYLRANTSTTDFRRPQVLYWNEDSSIANYYPTTRLDYQITPSVAVTGSWNLRNYYDKGQTYWPLPENPRQGIYNVAGYFVWSTGVNWTITPRTFNEFRYGTQHSGDVRPGSRDMYKINNRYMRVSPTLISAMLIDEAPVTGRHFIATMYDTATMIRGTHEITAGGSFRRTDWNDRWGDGANGILGVPRYTIGYPAGDSVSSIFSATSIPGINSNDISTAASLYALLTGRVSRIADSAAVNPDTKKYDVVEQGKVLWTRNYMGGFFVQDRWRAKPNLTLNLGLRWELQGDPFDVPGISAIPDMASIFGPSTALFKPGTDGGNLNPINKVGSHATNSRLNNLAPNLGIAWSPKFTEGILGKVFGNGKLVIRTAYSLVYYDEGTNMFAFNVGDNPGKTQALSQTPGQGDAPFGMTLQSPLATMVAFPPEFVSEFKQSDFTFGNTFRGMNPYLRTPYTQNWNLGIQYELAKNMVLEVRYVGNRATHGWHTYNLNEINIFENGFLQEFVSAQNNQAINLANGKTGFANNGLPGQVALPIFSAAFGARGSMPAQSGGSSWTSTTFNNYLTQGQAGNMANSLATSSAYVCRMFGSSFVPCTRIDSRYNAPGTYPINFWQLNPFSNGTMNYVDDDLYSNYHALQMNFRRQYSRGLSLSMNYTFAKNMGNTWANDSIQSASYQSLRRKDWNNTVTPFDLRHVFNGYATYDLPVGKGKLIPLNNNLVDKVIGGWQLGSIITIQSGTPFKLSSGYYPVNGMDGGVVLKNGLTRERLQDMMFLSPGPGATNKYWINPSLVGPDGRVNQDYIGLPTTPGQWGQTVILRGMNNFSLDASLVKNFRFNERMRMNIWLGAFNVLNHPVWGGGGGFRGTPSIQSTSFGLISGPSNSARSIQLRGTINF